MQSTGKTICTIKKVKVAGWKKETLEFILNDNTILLEEEVLGDDNTITLKFKKTKIVN